MRRIQKTAAVIFMLVASVSTFARPVGPANSATSEGTPSGTAASKTTDVANLPADHPQSGLATTAADPGLASRPLVKGDLRTFDISGFRLGMSPVEVQQVAAAGHLMASDGSRMVPFDPDRSGTRAADFKLNVARAVALRLGRPRPNGPTVVSGVLLYGQGGDKYYVDFLPMEAGPQLSSVMLIGSSKGNTPKSFLDAVVAKYGKPPQVQIGNDDMFAKWCSRGFPNCDDGPWFMVKTDDHEEQVKLTGGDRALIDLNHRIDAAGAAAAASAATKPKF